MCSSKGRKGHLLGQLHVRQEIACQSQTPRDAFYCSFPWVTFQKTFVPYLLGQKVSSIYIHCTFRNLVGQFQRWTYFSWVQTVRKV